jgi:hypothetical protein
MIHRVKMLPIATVLAFVACCGVLSAQPQCADSLLGGHSTNWTLCDVSAGLGVEGDAPPGAARVVVRNVLRSFYNVSSARSKHKVSGRVITLANERSAPAGLPNRDLHAALAARHFAVLPPLHGCGAGRGSTVGEAAAAFAKRRHFVVPLLDADVSEGPDGRFAGADSVVARVPAVSHVFVTSATIGCRVATNGGLFDTRSFGCHGNIVSEGSPTVGAGDLTTLSTLLNNLSEGSPPTEGAGDVAKLSAAQLQVAAMSYSANGGAAAMAPRIHARSRSRLAHFGIWSGAAAESWEVGSIAAAASGAAAPTDSAHPLDGSPASVVATLTKPRVAMVTGYLSPAEEAHLKTAMAAQLALADELRQFALGVSAPGTTVGATPLGVGGMADGLAQPSSYAAHSESSTDSTQATRQAAPSFSPSHVPLQPPASVGAPGFKQLVAGLLWLVRNGTAFIDSGVPERVEDMAVQESGNPAYFIDVASGRTAVGIDRLGRLTIAQIDGRSDWLGIDLRTFARWLAQEVGLSSAINLDGGASATFVRDGVLANVPSYSCLAPGAVGDALDMGAFDADGDAPTPAHAAGPGMRDLRRGRAVFESGAGAAPHDTHTHERSESDQLHEDTSQRSYGKLTDGRRKLRAARMLDATGNHGDDPNFKCRRSVSSALCIHDDPQSPQTIVASRVTLPLKAAKAATRRAWAAEGSAHPQAQRAAAIDGGGADTLVALRKLHVSSGCVCFNQREGASARSRPAAPLSMGPTGSEEGDEEGEGDSFSLEEVLSILQLGAIESASTGSAGGDNALGSSAQAVDAFRGLSSKADGQVRRSVRTAFDSTTSKPGGGLVRGLRVATWSGLLRGLHDTGGHTAPLLAADDPMLAPELASAAAGPSTLATPTAVEMQLRTGLLDLPAGKSETADQHARSPPPRELAGQEPHAAATGRSPVELWLPEPLLTPHSMAAADGWFEPGSPWRRHARLRGGDPLCVCTADATAVSTSEARPAAAAAATADDGAAIPLALPPRHAHYMLHRLSYQQRLALWYTGLRRASQRMQAAAAVAETNAAGMNETFVQPPAAINNTTASSSINIMLPSWPVWAGEADELEYSHGSALAAALQQVSELQHAVAAALSAATPHATPQAEGTTGGRPDVIPNTGPSTTRNRTATGPQPLGGGRPLFALGAMVLAALVAIPFAARRSADAAALRAARAAVASAHARDRSAGSRSVRPAQTLPSRAAAPTAPSARGPPTSELASGADESGAAEAAAATGRSEAQTLLPAPPTGQWLSAALSAVLRFGPQPQSSVSRGRWQPLPQAESEVEG